MRKIVADLESGLGDVPIMEKYHLSPAELMMIIQKLSDNDAVKPAAVKSRLEALKRTAAPSEMRSVPRNYLVFSIPIHDSEDPSIAGLVNDISENGLQVEGIETQEHEVRSFVIDSDQFSATSPVSFDAECRWVRKDETNGHFIAGFEITAISEGSLKNLGRLIKQLTIGDRL